MKAAIFLWGIPGIDNPQAIITIDYSSEKSLISELKSMQDGYCEDESPRIKTHTKSINGKVRKIIECYSSADFSHAAFIGMRLKESSNKPTKQLYK